MEEEIELQSNLDINEALKEFETKSGEQHPQATPEIPKAAEYSKMVRLVIKLSGGAIKDQRQAEYTLLVFIIIMIIITLYNFFG